MVLRWTPGSSGLPLPSPLLRPLTPDLGPVLPRNPLLSTRMSTPNAPWNNRVSTSNNLFPGVTPLLTWVLNQLGGNKKQGRDGGGVKTPLLFLIGGGSASDLLRGPVYPSYCSQPRRPWASALELGAAEPWSGGRAREQQATPTTRSEKSSQKKGGD